MTNLPNWVSTASYQQRWGADTEHEEDKLRIGAAIRTHGAKLVDEFRGCNTGDRLLDEQFSELARYLDERMAELARWGDL